MSKNKIPLMPVIFVCVQLLLYIMIFAVGGDLVRYLIIVFSATFAAFLAVKYKRGYLTAAAFIFTLCADWFLVMCKPREQLVGMIFFCGTQLLLCARLHLCFDSQRVRNVTLAVRIFVSLAVQIATIIVLGELYDALSAVSVFYFTNILLNAVFAFVQFKKSRGFAMGMLLFVACDIFVGLSSAAGTYLAISETSIIYKLANPSFDAAWMFYAPSQTLIALSTYNDNSIKEREKTCNH